MVPPATSVVYLPPQRIVSAWVTPLSEGWSALDLYGDFTRVDRGAEVRLAPPHQGDAEALRHALSRRFGLPRVPVDATPERAPTLPPDTYVRVRSTHRPGHPEAPNFGGLLLTAPPGSPAWSPGSDLVVSGFIDDNAAPAAGVPRPVDCIGPTLRAVEVTVLYEPIA